MGTQNSCNYAPTQYNIQTGGSNGTLNSVAPSATSGVPVISQGSSSQPIFGTAVVAGGGTGVTSTTAYAVLCGGTTSTAALQSIASVGTSGQILTSNGAGALPTFQAAAAGSGFTVVALQVFTGSGTYTPTANMKYCIVEAVGGGGAGGGTNGFSGGAGGGGAGGYSKGVYSAATIGASQTVTIGGGGTGSGTAKGGDGTATSLGALMTCNGGTGGAVITSSAASNGGAGGSASGGSLNITGGTGNYGYQLGSGAVARPSGAGASSHFGSGGAALQSGDQVGIAAIGYGAGGGGAVTASSNRAGGAGAAGVIIITEFI